MSAVFCDEQYEVVKSAFAGAINEYSESKATKPANTPLLLLSMVMVRGDEINEVDWDVRPRQFGSLMQ